MRDYQETNIPGSGQVKRKPSRIATILINGLLPLLALGVGVIITVYLVKTSPEATPRKRPPVATLVEVQAVSVGPQQTSVEAMGEIVPAQSIELKPKVAGEVVEISPEFIPGGYFAKGQTILRIESVDYSLIIDQLESEISSIESDLLLEMGNQRIAEKELLLLNEPVKPEERALILRKPQLAKLQSTLASARSRLAQAKLDFSRTVIIAPFNAMVSTRNVDVGAIVSSSSPLATLVGADNFWLRLTVPVDQLQWLAIPDNKDEVGARVKIFAQNGNREKTPHLGRIIRLQPSLEEQGRMAQILVEIDDPLSRESENRDKSKLLLGSYVRAEIEGKRIAQGIRIDREYLRDGNTVWVMNGAGALEIRKVDISFRGHQSVILSGGLASGDSLVISQLSSPVEGTPLRLASADSGSAQEEEGRRDKGVAKNEQ